MFHYIALCRAYAQKAGPKEVRKVPTAGTYQTAAFIPRDFMYGVGTEQGRSGDGVGTESEWGYARIING